MKAFVGFAVLTGMQLGFAALAPSRAATLAATGVTSQPFGQCAEGPVLLYTLTNAHHLRVSIMDYGATVVRVFTPDRDGHLEDIALGFDQPSAYAAAKLNFGTMGRYINRIAHGQVTLDGQVYQLTKNSGPNTMHGGKLGFNRRLWKARVVSNDPASLTMRRLSPDGEEGFPGNLQVSVTFTLTNDDHLRIHYEATTDKSTVVNLSNHTLFNLSGPGHGSILHDVAMVNADAFTPVDATSVPTGEIRRVDGTPWDLRKPTVLTTHIDDFGNQPPGYDFNYVLNKAGAKAWSKAGEVYDPKSGRDLQVFTDQPGVQFYTGNLFDGTLVGKGGVKYDRYCAFSLEAQHFPDSPNHANFPSTVLRPGTTYHATIEYVFGTKASSRPMKTVSRPYLAAALFLVTACVVCTQGTTAPLASIQEVAPTSSIQLWNGHDLTGWTAYFKGGAAAPSGFWSARDGVLHLAGRPTGYLRTEKVFANYHLHAEWRWPAPAKSGTNNSGIFVDQRPPDAVWPYSVQVQVKVGSCGDLIAQGGLTFSPGDTQLIRKKMATANEKPAGEWNVTDIYCRGASLEVFVNGVRQNFVDKLPASSGQIALQMEGYPIEFRNLWLQQL